MAFKLFIGTVEVSRYVHSDSLEEYNQKVEGDEIWSYYLDNLSFSLDKSVCDEFADIDVDNTHLFYNKTVELYYYGNLVFGGVITSKIGYDYRDTIDIEAASYGRIVADLEISTKLENFDVSRGDNLRGCIYQYLFRVNELLTEQNYPFTIFNNWDDNPINATDFTTFKSLTTETVDSPLPGSVQIYQKTALGGEGIDNAYYIFSIGAGTLGAPSAGYRLTEEGIDTSRKITMSDVNRVFYKRVNEIEDVGAREFQKDFAVVTNSLTWVGTDKKMYYQNRDGLTGLSVKNVYDMTSETLSKTAELSVTDGLWKYISDEIKESIQAYYNDYFLGTFIKYKLLINREEFTEDEYPLMLKRLKVWRNNKTEDCGIIKEATFNENTIELVTERRIE